MTGSAEKDMPTMADLPIHGPLMEFRSECLEQGAKLESVDRLIGAATLAGYGISQEGLDQFSVAIRDPGGGFAYRHAGCGQVLLVTEYVSVDTLNRLAREHTCSTPVEGDGPSW